MRLPQARHRDTPAVGVLGQAGVLAELARCACRWSAARVEVVALEQHLAQADVHVGGAAQRRVRRAASASPAVERPRRVAEPALRDLDVGQAERAAEDVGEVVRRPRSSGRRRCTGARGRRGRRGPVREAEQCGGAPRPEMIVGLGEIEGRGRRARWCRRCRRRAVPAPARYIATWPGSRANSSWSNDDSAVASDRSQRRATTRRSSSGSTPVESPVAIRAPDQVDG